MRRRTVLAIIAVPLALVAAAFAGLARIEARYEERIRVVERALSLGGSQKDLAERLAGTGVELIVVSPFVVVINVRRPALPVEECRHFEVHFADGVLFRVDREVRFTGP